MKPAPPFRAWAGPPVAGWHRAVVRPACWPVPPELRPQWIEAGCVLHRRLLPEAGRVIAALQVWHLHEGGAARILGANAPRWNPDFGAGVWLDEPPPRLWTEEELLRLPPGSKVRPPLYQLVRVQPEAADFPAVWREIGGRNAWLALSLSCNPETFLASQAEAYRQWITDPTLLASGWYLPLLRARSAESPLFAARRHHLDLVATYLRESEEDGGLLIWSRMPLAPVLEELGLEAEAGPPHG